MVPFLVSTSRVHPHPLRSGGADPHRPKIASGASGACRPARRRSRLRCGRGVRRRAPGRNQGRCWRQSTPGGALHAVGRSCCGDLPITRRSRCVNSGLCESTARRSGPTERQKSDGPNRPTPSCDAVRLGAAGICLSAGSEILRRGRGPRFNSDVPSGLRWQGPSRTTIDVRGVTLAATALRRAVAAMTLACLRRDPILPTHAGQPPGYREVHSFPAPLGRRLGMGLALTAHAVRGRLRQPPGPGCPGFGASTDLVSIPTETHWVADETVEFTTEERPTATESQMGNIAATWSTNLELANRCVAIPTHSLRWSLKPMQRASRSTDGCAFPP